MQFNINRFRKPILLGIIVLLLMSSKIDIGKSKDIIEPSLKINMYNFEMTESSITSGFEENIELLNFTLPSSSWKVNEFELNFTNVDFVTEILAIEDQPIDGEIIDKFHDGYGVHLVINDPTILYGVEIYGNNESSENLPIEVQIRGYDELTNAPNNTVYGSPTILNMSYSETATWHQQMFLEPIYLLKGNYYLVIDASIIGNSPKSEYTWFFNDINPLYSELYHSALDSGTWSVGIQGSPFLYKLIQKVNTTFFPEDINMTAQLDENSYKVSNGNNKGQGYLKKTDVNYHPHKKDLSIIVRNNKTNGLKFNLEYNINIENDFQVFGSASINYNNLSINHWSLAPNISRKSNNYSVCFIYPDSWEDIRIYRNSQDFTSNVSFNTNENEILIPNKTIEAGAVWELTANSPLVPVTVNAIKNEFRMGQELRFSIGNPILDGNYSFILYDPLNLITFQLSKQIPLENNIFSYSIPSNAHEGKYLGLIFWNNATDAGMTTIVFNIISAASSPAPFDFSVFIIIGTIAIGGSGLGITGYKVMKKVESNKRYKLRIILEKCNDIMNLEYVIVLDMKSGIDVYSQSFGKKELDSTLISGFLQAIHNFGVEVIEGAKESRTVKVEYQKSIVIMTDFINVRLITIMKSHPSENFLYNIESLAYDIYKNFGKDLEEFQGGLKKFQGIKPLVEKHYNVKFLYPLKAVLLKNAKLGQEERELVKRATNYMKENKVDYFYSLYLLPDNSSTPKDYELILTLIEKGVFQPIDKEWIS